MANSSAAQTQPDDRAQDMLGELEQAHKRLSECMMEMDEVTRDAVPDRFRITRARFRISSASLARRQLFNTICADLLPRVSAEDARRIDEVRQTDRERMNHSAAHVAKWSSDAAVCDWASYCRASHDIRGHMRQTLDQELRVLVPLLRRYISTNSAW